MELTRAQETALRRTGREALEKAVTAATSSISTGGIKRSTAKVTAVNDDQTVDVDFGDSAYAMPLQGLRYTTDCSGVAAGDRVIVDTTSHQSTVTGVIATSDTGGYDIFAGTKVINTSSSNVLFTDAEFTAAFGRSFNYVTDCIIGMNGDSATQSGKTCDLSYSPGNKNIWLEGVGSVGNYRVNYILAMPSGSTRTVAQGVASATSRATSAAEAANEAAKAAQEAASGVTEATDKANAAAESATTAAGKVDAAVSEATTAATKATDAAAGAESAATSATSATAAAEKVNATLDGTKLTVTSRDGSTATVDTKGERGEKGETGAQGAKGDKGDKGDTGDTGATGAKGDKGDKGDTGAKGADGAGARWNLLPNTLNGIDWTCSAFDRDTRTFSRSTTATTESFIFKGGIPLTVGETYTMSATVWSNEQVSSFDMFVYDKNAKKPQSKLGITPTTAPTRYSFTFTVPDVDGADWSASTIRWDNNGSKSAGTKAVLYVREPKLEQASAATDYRPAIADIADATEAEYDRQVARGTYAGRSIQTILGCSSWADTYAALHARVSAADFSGLRVGDYMDVTFSGTDLITTATQRFVLAHFDPYLNTGATALTSHHLAFVAQKAVTVASGVTGYVNGGRIQWNTTATNNGTSAQPAPYIASNLHAFESKLTAELPSSISGYVISRTARLETRYSSSGTLADSNGSVIVAIGQLWSMSQDECLGGNLFGTRTVPRETQAFDLMLKSANDRAALRSSAYWLRDAQGGSSSGVAYYSDQSFANVQTTTWTWAMPRPCFLFS